MAARTRLGDRRCSASATAIAPKAETTGTVAHQTPVSQGKSDAAPNDRANANASPLSTPTPASETAISRATRANGSARKRGRYAGTKMTSAARAAATGRVASGGSSQRTADQAATAANAAASQSAAGRRASMPLATITAAASAARIVASGGSAST